MCPPSPRGKSSALAPQSRDIPIQRNITIIIETRDEGINEMGYFVLRISEQQVRNDLDGAVEVIQITMEELEKDR